MVRKAIPEDYEVVATFGARKRAKAAKRYLEKYGLKRDVAVVKPGGMDIERTAARTAYAALIGVLLGLVIAWLWPFEADDSRYIVGIAAGLLIGSIIGLVTPDRSVERMGELHVAVKRRWAEDARRMLIRRAENT